ncbi:MAG: hypothetical protein AAFP18_00960 [Bacteroidota bacterium]
MGRFLVLIVMVAAVTTATTLLRDSSTRLDAQRKQSATHDLALAREAADAAHTAVLTAMLRGGQLNNDLPLAETFEIDGRSVRIDRFEPRGDTVYFSVTGMSGGSQHSIASNYLVTDVDFPGPLWIDAPYATATIDPMTTINAVDDDGLLRASYLDYSKLYDYRLDNILSASTMVNNIQSALSAAAGTRQGLDARQDLGSVLSAYSTPSLVELYGDILSGFTAQDVQLTASTTLSSNQAYGQRGSRSVRDARFVRVEGDLRIPSGRTLEGNGVLLVEGNLVVEGTLRWDGLIYIRSFEQEVRMDVSTGTAEIRGALIVEQEAPPPGGHMDLTIYRDMTGQWAQPSGEIDMYSNSWTQHTHRSERFMPDRQVTLLDRPGGNPHESYSRLSETLGNLSPTDQVFFEFDNLSYDGLANFRLAAEDTTRVGSINGGFGGFSASDIAQHRTRTFEAQDIDAFEIDIRSLRLLKHHFDDEPTTDPEADCTWNTYPWNTGCVPLNWPFNTKWLYDRGGALRVKLFHETLLAEDLIYEAVFYWHRRGAWDTAERDAEIAADQQWRTDIENGMGYGSAVNFGPNVTLEFDQARLEPALRRLGYSSDNIRHLASAAQSSTASEQAMAEASEQELPTGGPQEPSETVICYNGLTMSKSGTALEYYLSQGATQGPCAEPSEGNDAYQWWSDLWEWMGGWWS